MSEETKKYTITLDDDPMIFRIVEKMTDMKSLPFTSSEKLLARAESYRPAAAFIDVHLGVSESGLDIIPQLRKLWPYTPIIVVTSGTKNNLVGQALATGANDFVRKPLDKEELLGRLHARISEMHERKKDQIQRVGEVTFNYKLRSLENEGKTAYISPLESELLHALIQAKGMVVPREVLKRKLWGEIKISDNALDRRISELRKSIKDVDTGVKIKSVYGSGVVIKVPEKEQKMDRAA